MDYDQFRKLNQDEAFAAVSQHLGIDESMVRAQIAQESGNNPNAVSRAGARGWAQIMPATQRSLEKRDGRKYDPSNFNDALWMYQSIMKEGLDAEQGNVDNARRYYNGGPKWRDNADPTGENAAYNSAIYARAGYTPEQIQKAHDAFAAIHKNIDASAAKLPDHSVSTLPTWDTSIDSMIEDYKKAKAAEDATSLLDAARATVMAGQGVTGALVHRLVDPEFGNDAVPGYQPTAEQVAGYTDNEDNFDLVMSARSDRELNYRKFQIDNEREQMQTMQRAGKVSAFLAPMVADAPALLGIGMGVSGTLQAVGLGARAAAATGNTGRALALSTLEQGTAGAVTAGVEAALGGRVSASDVVMDVAGGILLGVPFEAPGLVRSARMANIRRTTVQTAIDAQAMKTRFNNEAIEALGPDAHPDAIAAEASRREYQYLADRQAEFTSTKNNAASRMSADYDRFLEEELAAQERVSQPIPEGQEVNRAEGGMVTTTPEMSQSNSAIRAKLNELGDGIHVDMTSGTGKIQEVLLTRAHDLVKALADKLLPADARIMVKLADSQEIGGKNVGGLLSAWQGQRDFVLRLNKDTPVSIDAHMNTVVHEVFHMVDTIHMGAVPADVRAAAMASFQKFAKAVRDGNMEEALGMRFNAAAHAQNGGAMVDAGLPKSYVNDPAEFIAEQGVKYVHDDLMNGGNKLNIPANITKTLKGWIDAIVQMIRNYGKVEKLTPEDGMRKFFDAVIAGKGSKTAVASGFTKVNSRAPVDVSFLQDPIALKYGLDKMPVDTPGRRAEARAIIEMYRRADDPTAVWNNMPKDRLNPLTAKFDWAASTSIAMLRSENPVMRMIASELLETTTGAAGREATASLTKYLVEGKLRGNFENDYARLYDAYRNAVGGSLMKDFTDGAVFRKFNEEVAVEIERRADPKYEGSSNPHIKAAADAAEAAFERHRIAQKEAKTVGWAGLPDTSRGYLPHMLSPEKVLNATPKQINALHNALVDQFVSMGWDFDFATNLASKYIQRVEIRARGGYESSMNHHTIGAADMVEDALNAMGLSEEEVRSMMQRYMRGGAGFTKKRMDLDMLKEYQDDNGVFRLIDLYDTNIPNLLKQQSQRISGEVALAKYGIMGRPGLKLVRAAVAKGQLGQKATQAEIGAFDQVAAEFLGDPFGTQAGKWMNRAIQFNSLARLGGMGFTQAAETINAATILGVHHAAAMIPAFARLRGEAAALARGEKVNNSLLQSIELRGGKEFGTDGYRMVFPFDNPGVNYAVAGQQTNELADRLLRGGLHAQAKLSGWRAIHAAQNRGVAEQIVLKALRYIREGKEDIALRDMGFTKDVQDAIRAEYNDIVKMDGDLVREFDITKMKNDKAANAFIQAVHRGTNQIIQGTFIGETGKWAHDGMLRLMTQFRTFSLTSVEKQWARTRANFGVGRAALMLMGSMSMAAPIYMARVYAQSLGRKDQEEFLAKRLQWDNVARATLNYIALSGLAGDFMDALGSVAGYSTTGGRPGAGSDFFGNIAAPSVGLVNDLYRGIQNTKNGTDPTQLMKALPFSNSPLLIPVINLLKP